MAGQMVTFPSNGHTCEGYLALPAFGKAPAVVVMQEWWGMTPWIRSVVDRFAAAGYVALAPDLYHGKVTDEPDEATKLMMAMQMDVAAKDMSGAYDFVASHSASTGKAGSVGFCLGGGLSLFAATLRPFDACVIYYGVLPGVQPDLAKLAGPVLGHYAEHDSWASPDAARQLEAQIRAAGKSVEFHIYDGAKHAFCNPSPEVEKVGGKYDEAAAATSWDRTLAFYKQHLA
ncbi:MAG TPA: dienelactone hydrolase family protein [Dehalococcoidia bacterium]|nr:dienelactone hydrolase family protein [Dehalococcoidia bacterium]